jgi:hypothetical protein
MISIPFQFYFEGDLTFDEVPAGTLVAQTIDVPAIIKDEFCLVAMPELQEGLTFSNPICNTRGELTLKFRNDTAGALTPDGTGVRIVQI